MMKFGKGLDKSWEKNCLIRQSRTKYSKQSKEIERNWKELENLISVLERLYLNVEKLAYAKYAK